MGYIDSLTKRIQEEAKRYSNRREVARAGILEILSTKYLSPDEMHPNPDDEFSDPDVGPNESIVEKYVQEALDNLKVEADSFDDPILVAKMQAGDYMIINGHHRWAAAIKVKLNRVHVAIANPGKENLASFFG